MDDELRRLERAWQESGDPADEGRLLLARMRKGELPRRALEVAAWVGLSGPGAALPDAAPPPADDVAALEGWAGRLRELVGGYAEATWRLVHAEAERVVAWLADPPPPTYPPSRLILIEGPRSGAVEALGGEPVQLGADSQRAPLSEACLRVEWADGYRLVPLGEVQLNGDPIAEPQLLEHGDLVTFGACFAIFDANDPVEMSARVCRVARLWLDELAACVATRGTPRDDLPDPPPGDALATWLAQQIERLRGALADDAPVPLAPWPAEPPGREHAARWTREVRATAQAALGGWALQVTEPLRTPATRALDRLQIASPCPMTWEELAPRPGEPQVRDCGECRLAVFDVAALSRAEAEALLEREGSLCLRLYRRADGRVMTRDCLSSERPGVPDHWNLDPPMLGRISL